MQIMESLGGDIAWIDRFVAQHAAIFYFWAVLALYALSPRNAYQFSELVEGHATDTYQGMRCLSSNNLFQHVNQSRNNPANFISSAIISAAHLADMSENADILLIILLASAVY
jgi:hypothetical protein